MSDNETQTAPRLVRLRDKQGIQILTTEDKATRLIAEGRYKAVPDDEQPKETEQPRAREARGRERSRAGSTSIAGALRGAVGPDWQHAG